jgi:hypothetical protein
MDTQFVHALVLRVERALQDLDTKHAAFEKLLLYLEALQDEVALVIRHRKGTNTCLHNLQRRRYELRRRLLARHLQVPTNPWVKTHK